MQLCIGTIFRDSESSQFAFFFFFLSVTLLDLSLQIVLLVREDHSDLFLLPGVFRKESCCFCLFLFHKTLLLL